MDKAVFEFPDTTEGPVLVHEFVITNTGSDSLEISDARVSCSCTKVILPQEPIAPGEQGVITVTFDTNGKFGDQDRKILLTTNTKKGHEQLRFKVYVIPLDETR